VKKRSTAHDERGMLLLVLIITIPFLIAIAVYYMRLSLTSFQVARFDQLHTEAQLAADAGADYGVEQVNADNSWPGTSGEITLHSDSSLRTTFSVNVVTNSSTSKTMQITGRTYWPSNTTAAARSTTIYVDLRAVVSGNFSVVSGEGGLVMSNSAKIVGGSVFVNGTIDMQNNSQIGLSTNPVNVSVADQACPNPPDATYPRVCNANEGAQPISLSTNAHIYGTVKATNQTNGTGMTDSGLQAGSTVATKALPTYDRTAQKNAVTTTIAGPVNCSNGSLTWAANTKITGNVSLSNNCRVTVQGNVWITGTLTMNQSSRLIVADTLGTTVPVIMVDGSGGATFSNASALVANSSNTGFEIITFWSAASSCSPDCSSVTGTNLYNSRNVTTINLQNNSTAANSIFYAYWSQVTIGNSGQIGALIGQTVNLTNNGAITFGSTVSGSGETAWVIQGYRRH
jgi:hypothetical protein